MDRVFAQQIGRNLEIYIDDMLVIKTTEEGSHDRDLEEISASVRKYDMRLNPAKCSFGVQAGKFLGFILTSREIEANLEKCQAITNMRSPTTAGAEPLVGWTGPWPAPNLNFSSFYRYIHNFFKKAIYNIYFALHYNPLEDVSSIP
jgi:hypothetical protein